MREDAEKTSGLLLVLALVFLGGLSGIWIWKKKARAGPSCARRANFDVLRN